MYFQRFIKAISTQEKSLRFFRTLFPIEIKKSASLGKEAIKNFHVLEPVTRTDTFNDLETLKVEIGTGSVICMSNDLLPVDEKNWYVPAWLI